MTLSLPTIPSLDSNHNKKRGPFQILTRQNNPTFVEFDGQHIAERLAAAALEESEEEEEEEKKDASEADAPSRGIVGSNEEPSEEPLCTQK
jgi:hypothetical protein